MKAVKLAIFAATMGALGLTAIPADARPPHKVRVCKTQYVHHHKVQRCNWVVRR